MALAIVGILMSIAIPAFVQMRAAHLMRTTTSELMGELAYARVEAVKRSTRIGLARNSADWAGGWAMFEDSDRDGVKDAGEPVISEHGALLAGLKLCLVGDEADVLSIGSDGRFRAYDAGAPVTGLTSIKVSANKAAPGGKAREVVIGPSGRASVNAAVGLAECP